MQKGSFTKNTPRFDTEGVVNRINLLAQKFRNLDLPVIYIQHDGTRDNEFLPNTFDWEILSELNVIDSDIKINKYANDVFYKSNLKKTLTEYNVNELYITGCATDFCVEATIQSALAKDFNLTIVADGHTTGERPHLKATQVIEHYNWVWQNMIPTKGNISVINYKKIKL